MTLLSMRLGASLTQADMAFQLGVSRQSIARIETGTQRPSLKVLMAAREAFHLTPEQFLSLVTEYQ